MESEAGTSAGRSVGFWIDLVIGLVPATFIIAPKLLHWGWLFGYGLWMRMGRSAVFSSRGMTSLALSTYYLAWDFAALIAVVCLWIAVVTDPERLRRRLVSRGLLIAGLLAGFLATIQFATRPLLGLSFTRQPWLWLVLAGPLVVAARHIWILARPRRPTPDSGTPAAN